jgi:hypothetical protein
MFVDQPDIRVGPSTDVLRARAAGQLRGDLGGTVEALTLDHPVAG